MTCEENIECVHSNVVVMPIFSEDDQDYRALSPGYRITDDGNTRLTDADELRILEK